MGRYTTVQTFTDQDAKAAISYSSATATTASSSVSHYGPGGGDGATQRADDASSSGGDKHQSAKVTINRVENVSGSSAGAGSGDFHMYRAARRRELERVERMEKEYEQRKIKEEFEKKRLQSMTEFEARAHKRAEKRRRRKERSKAKSLSTGNDDDNGDSEGESKGNVDAPKQKKQKTAAEDSQPEVFPETPGGVPEIPNDGSFLERMLAEQKKKGEQQQQQ